jgi:hypothetical protein
MAGRPQLGSARVHTGDRQIDDVQSAARRTADAVNRCPFLNGALQKDQALTTASKTFSHGLGRTPRGCLVLKSTVATSVGFPAAQPTDTTKQSNLIASVAATADLWWF